MSEAAEVFEIVARIRPLLAGKPACVQGAVLADLLAMWVAGHHVAGNPAATDEMRARLLSDHFEGVCKLTVINAHLNGTMP